MSAQRQQIKILVVEDEALVADHIAACLHDLGYTVCGICDNAPDALLAAQAQNPDMALLDINLQGALDGVDLAQQLTAKYRLPFIFLTSNSDARTIERVKYAQPMGFILKPFVAADLESNIEIALFKLNEKAQNIQGTDDAFFVKDKHALVKLRYHEVTYAEALDNYTVLYTVNGKYIVPQTLKVVGEKMQPHGFTRVHRSFLVNTRHIAAIHPRHILVSGVEIPVSEAMRAELLKQVSLL